MNAKHVNEIIAKARFSAKNKQWKNLFEFLLPIYEEELALFPNEAYHQLILAAAKNDEFDVGERVIHNSPKEVKERLDYKTSVVEFYFRKEELVKCLPYLESIHRESETKISVRMAKIYAIILKELDNSQAEKSRKRAVGAVSELADLAYSALDRNEKNAANKYFSKATRRLLGDVEEAFIWNKTFKSVCDIFLRNKPPLGYPITSDGCASENPLSSLCVSGMGWSGSGALYDFFSEFEEVKRVKGEFPFIQGKTGISGLFKSLGKDRERKAIVDLFKYNLFSFCGEDGIKNHKSVRYAKALVRGKRQKEYSEISHHIITRLLEGYFEGDLNLSNLRRIVNSYLRFRSDIGDGESLIPMFDNIIHAYNIDSLRFINNTNFFCTVRDPRSNFVANVRENVTFNRDVKAYVNSYRQKRDKIKSNFDVFVQECEVDIDFRSNVFFVQFEDFVMNKDYRIQMAKNAGLSLDARKEFSFFKPWESEKNVFLFENYENQDEIRYIEKELAEYCIDLDAFQSMRTST